MLLRREAPLVRWRPFSWRAIVRPTISKVLLGFGPRHDNRQLSPTECGLGRTVPSVLESGRATDARGVLVRIAGGNLSGTLVGTAEFERVDRKTERYERGRTQCRPEHALRNVTRGVAGRRLPSAALGPHRSMRLPLITQLWRRRPPRTAFADEGSSDRGRASPTWSSAHA